MSYKRFTVRIKDQLLQEIKRISQRNNQSTNETIKTLMELGAEYFPYKEKIEGFEPAGKQSLTKAERLAIHCAIKSEILLHGISSKEEISKAEEKTKNILEKSWHYKESNE